MSPPAIHLILLSLLAATLHAQSPLEQMTLELFESKCSKCHKDDEEPELSARTDLAALRRNDKHVRAGDAANSPLYKLVTLPHDDKKRMPKSKASKPLPPLNDEEKQLLADWIQGAGTPVASRAFLNDDYVGKAILDDLRSVPTAQAAGFRYLSLANVYNERDSAGRPAVSDEEMEHCRTGVTKLMNSLSMKPKITPVTPIDANKIVLRISLQDYDFSPSLWSRVISAYPYLVRSNLASITEAEGILGVWPVMRADYFVFAFAQPPLYHEALGIPGGTGGRGADVALEAKLGIAYDKAILEPDAQRAGFQHSRVSQGNRLIERLPRPDGHYYWKSYDFDPNRQNERGADVFRSPLGPSNAALTTHAELKFSHDGGEIVFSLPNRLQGYMLINAFGKRLDEGPVNVVTDKSKDSRGGRIINGISCIRCHADGIFMTGVHDEVLGAVGSIQLDATDRATLERLHNSAKLDSLMKADAAHYAQAVALCGPAGKTETISLLYTHFVNALNPGQLAGELGHDVPGLIEKLAASTDPEISPIVAKFRSNAPVPRIDFEKAFKSMVAVLGLGSVPAHDRLSFTEFGGNLDLSAIQNNESGGGVTVRTPIKNREILTLDAPSQGDGDTTAGGAGFTVKIVPPGSRSGDSTGQRSVHVIRINADGTVAPASTALPAGAATPGTAAPVQAPGTPGRKVFKIETPKPGEDDFNTQQVPPPVVKKSPQ